MDEDTPQWTVVERAFDRLSDEFDGFLHSTVVAVDRAMDVALDGLNTNDLDECQAAITTLLFELQDIKVAARPHLPEEG
ncbi:MAG: hypothetical protein JWL76_623 [Thermoleophilia bacterium]|nr:hypothetical protein [Thermoleophilia bacterium]